MVQICPHCRHVRKPTDQTPDWQCPACERAYNKTSGPAPEATVIRQVRVRPENERGGIGKWLFVALVVGSAYVWLKPDGATAGNEIRRAKNAPQPAVTLYATSWCGYCAATRDFFNANGIVYTELDIERSAEGAAGHRKLNGNGVPLIVVGDAVIHGYNEAELRSELKPWLKRS